MPKPAHNRPAVVLLSGGLDSTTVLAVALDQGFLTHALSFRYGQRHTFELASAAKIAAAAGVEHRVVDIDLAAFGGSALVGDGTVPKDRTAEEIGEDIPATYVPARNTVFLSLALAWAETLVATDLFIGVNALDYSGYPDCRPEFVEAFERVANLGTRTGVEDGGPYRIHAPLVSMTKAQIIRTGTRLGVDYSMTTSCYDPTDAGACGACDACRLRLAGFAEAGLVDPITYRTEVTP